MPIHPQAKTHKTCRCCQRKQFSQRCLATQAQKERLKPISFSLVRQPSIKEILQTYKNLNRLTSTKTLIKEEKNYSFSIVIILLPPNFASTFFKNFTFFSKKIAPHIPFGDILTLTPLITTTCATLSPALYPVR